MYETSTHQTDLAGDRFTADQPKPLLESGEVLPLDDNETSSSSHIDTVHRLIEDGLDPDAIDGFATRVDHEVTEGVLDPNEAVLALVALIRASTRRASDLSHENKRLQHEAYTDKLTGLGNRRALDLAIERGLKEGEYVAEADVANLKAGNECVSEDFGDAMMQVAGQSLAEVMEYFGQSTRHAFRKGGDEIAAIIDTPHAQLFADRLDLMFRHNIYQFMKVNAHLAFGVELGEHGEVRPYVISPEGKKYHIFMRTGFGLNLAEAGEAVKAIKAQYKGDKFRKI